MNIVFHKCEEGQGSLARFWGTLRRTTISIPILSLLSAPAFAAALGMVTDNESDQLRLFDAETGIVVASLQGSTGRINGDCAINKDETHGFSSNASHKVSVFQFSETTFGQSVNLTSIDISNAGVDMSLSPDGGLLVTAGAGHVDQPLSMIDTVSLKEVATNAPFLNHTSAEFCDDGTLLLTTTYGNSFASPFDNAMYDATVSPDGDLQLGGNRLSSGAQPNNGSCAPGSGSGVLLDPENGQQTGLVHAGDATGVCFAQRQPLIPHHEIAFTAP